MLERLVSLLDFAFLTKHATIIFGLFFTFDSSLIFVLLIQNVIHIFLTGIDTWFTDFSWLYYKLIEIYSQSIYVLLLWIVINLSIYTFL